MRIQFNKMLSSNFANFILNTDVYKKQIRSLVDGTTSVAALYPKNYFSIEIPVPDIEIQRQIVAQIQKEQELVNASKQLIEIFEQKIKERIAKVWGASTTSAVETPKLGVSTDLPTATPSVNSDDNEETLAMAAEDPAEYLKI